MRLLPDYVFFAESVIRDESKKVSIISMFDKVWAEKLPTAQAKLVVIFGLKAEDDKKESRALNLYVYTPDKKLLLKTNIPYEFTESKEAQVVVDFSGMPITQYGKYRFELGHNEKEIVSARSLEVSPLKDR